MTRCLSGRTRPLSSLVQHAFVALASVSRSGSDEQPPGAVADVRLRGLSNLWTVGSRLEQSAPQRGWVERVPIRIGGVRRGLVGCCPLWC